MNPVLLILPGIFIGFLICIGIITVYWFLEINVHQPATNFDSYRHMYVTTELGAIWSDLGAFIVAIPTLLIGGFASVITGVLRNAAILFLFFLLTIVSFGFLQYGSPIVQNIIIVRQCVLVPFAYSLVFPLLNALRIIYNAAIMLWNYYVDLSKIGATKIIIKCALATTDVSSFFAYFCNIFLVWTEDMIAWFAIGFLDHNFDIVNTLDAIGLFLDQFVLPLTCLCQVLAFLWEALSIWVRMRSLHAAINLIFNFIISLLQIPINTMMVTPHIPKFDRAAIVGCGALKETASTIEDTLYLIAQTGWGIFSGDEALPLDIQIFLSAQWAHIIADPLCGVVIFANMTLTVVVNYDDLTDSEGIAYFQFGLIVDQLISASGHFASIFALWNNDAQATIDQILNVIIYLIAFVFEWIPGNIYYFLYGGPLPLYPSAPFVSPANFLQYYFSDYWLKPTFDNSINNSTYVYQTALNSAFNAAFMSSQAIGNLIANLMEMDPLGGIIQHLLNMIICLVQILANFISFFFAIITFNTDPRTTFKQVNFDNFFNEMYYLATSSGDFWRQFATPDPLTNFTCQISVNEDEHSVWCCTGNLVERLIDVIAVGLQQIVHFLQDLATLPTGNVMFCIIFIPFNATNANQCVRIPELSTALFLLDQALCDFTCAVFSVIPLISEFQCSFPLPVPPTNPNVPPEPPKPCGHVSTCSSNLACSILRLLLVPLIVANTFFSTTMQGVSYSSHIELTSMITQIFFNVVAQALEAFGLLVNCVLCAFTSTGTNCDDDIYQIFRALAELVRFLPLIFNKTFFVVLRLALAFFKGFFTGDPIGAVIEVVVGLLQDVLGGLGAAVVEFLVRFFDGIGLGFIGTFIKVLWTGFCPLLQAVLNTIILGLKAVTFGLVQINFVDFCCDGSPTCTPSSRKRGMVGGILNVDLAGWISELTKYFHWEEGNPCNTSMTYYGQQNWNNLTEWQQNEALLCLVKPYWLARNDDQTDIGNSTCDVLMIEYNNTVWTEIDILTRRNMIDCFWSRLITDGLRQSTNTMWIPSDILTNPYRKYVFGAELAKGFLIYWQYRKDRSVTSETFFSELYKGTWASYGLNVSCYNGITTVDDILWFRSKYTLKDYFIWNGNAAQYEPVQTIVSGAGTFFQQFLTTLGNTTTAFSDTQLDPTVYLQYSYSMDDSAAAITSSVYYLLNDLVNGSKTIYNYWTSPETIQKRANGYSLLKNGTWGMYKAGMNQLTKMAAEYWQDKREISDKYWSGNCLHGECEEFMRQYNESFHNNEHSLVYQLSHWYKKNKDTLFKVYPIRHGPIGREATHEKFDKLFHWYNRKGQNDTYKVMMTQSTRQDGHPVWVVHKKIHGEEHSVYSRVKPRESDRTRIYNQSVSEKGRERFWRVYELFSRGSPGSRKRWEGVSKIWTTFKERVYYNVLTSNLEEAVDFIERVYRNPDHKSKKQIVREEEEQKRRESNWEWERLQTEKSRLMDLENGARQSGSQLVLRNRDYSNLAMYQQIALQKEQICPEWQVKNKDGICSVRTPAREKTREPEPTYYNDVKGVDYLSPIMIHGQGEDYFRNRPLHPLGEHPKGVIMSPKSGIRKLGRSEFFQQAVVSIDIVFNLTCYTNITFGNSTLCDECFILDQIVGRIEAGLDWMLAWYTAPEFTQNLEMAQDFFTYAFDDNAVVVVGDSPQLQVGEFPGFDTNDGWYNVRYLGDNVPNKTRFSDVIGMIQNATNSTNSTPIITGNGYWINDTIAAIVNAVFGWLWDLFQKLFEYISGGGGSMGVTQGFDFYVDWFYTCDWMTGRDVRSLDIRFSFGEGVLMYFVTFTTISVILMATIEWSILNIFLTSTGLLILASSFGSIVYNFAYKCIPALPGALADSVFYFLAYTVLPKCSWFWGFMIANVEYDNEHCFPCEQADQWQIIECVDDLGFGDITANIVFMIQFYAPSWLQWIRDSRWLPIAILYHIPQVNERLNEFTDIDMSNRKTYAHYMGCNYIMTLIPNLFIAIVFLYILYLLSPLAYAFLTLGWLGLLLIYSLFRLANLMWEDIFITQTVAPFIMSGIMDGPVMDQQLSDFTIPGRVSPKSISSNSGTRLGMTYQQGGEKSGFSLNRMRNMIRRGMDNLFITDRKTR